VSFSQGEAGKQVLLQVQGICKAFGATSVLRSIDLQISDSEFVCLLGASGCGKTSLLRIICGIESPDAGRLIYRGNDITASDAAQRRFGIVFQSYALFPNLTALDNVAYGLSGTSRAHQNSRAQEMLDLVGLSALARRYPAQLSGGQQQRVALARALAPRPSLLLLDEPLSALDAQVRQNLRGELKRIQRELKMPVVMVTHDQQEAMELADRIILMNQGQIEQSGTPRELYSRPKSDHVARFTGRANIWPAQLESMEGAVQAFRVGQARVHMASDPSHPLVSREALKIFIRPESVQVDRYVRAHSDSGRVNQYNAVVDDIVYSGATQTLRLQVPSLDTVVNAERIGASTQEDAYYIGQACSIVLPSEHLRVLTQ
jgi:iron(III) transport system ATP-binding protein